MRRHARDTARRHALAALALCLVGAPIYWNALGASFVFDDYNNILLNPFVRVTRLAVGDLLQAAFLSPSPRPISNLSFALNYYLGGYDPLGYHAFNLLVHLVSAFGVYLLADATLRRLAGISRAALHPDPARIPWLALFAGLVFVAHPIQTQSVTYVVQRMSCLATLFYLAAFLLYLYGRLRQRGRWRLWSAGLLCWLLAVGSKQTAFAFFASVWLYEWYFFRDLDAAWARRSLPALVGLYAVLALVAVALYYGMDPFARYTERDFGMGERLLTQPRVLALYGSLIALPLPSRLNLVHDLSLSRSLLEPATTALALLGLVGWLGLALGLARRRRLLSFAALWLPLHLFLESTLLPLELVFEHRVYLPMVGVALAAARLLEPLLAKRAAWGAALAVALIACLGAGTRIRNETWTDDVLLWSDVAGKSPRIPRAHSNLGAALTRAGRGDLAVPAYREALRLDPDFADAHYNLALALRELGALDDAVHHLSEALRIRPEHADTHAELGKTLAARGDPDGALQNYRDAVRLNPYHAPARHSLALALSDRGLVGEALEHLTLAIRLDPARLVSRNLLGLLLERRGSLEAAMREYTAVLRIAPGFHAARFNLSRASALRDEGQHLTAQFRSQLQERPDSADARVGLAAALAQLGRRDEAEALCRGALELRPDHTGAHGTLGALLLEQRRDAEAIPHLERALRGDPDDRATRERLAWVLATSADDALRDPTRSLGLAEEGIERADGGDARPFDTLAAAYAATGRFAEARDAAARAEALAEARGEALRVSEIRHRRALYRSERAYRAGASAGRSD